MVSATRSAGGLHPVVCRNTVSGAAWTLRVDAGARTVDGFPAEFSSETVVWRDPRDSGNYSLDRNTGELLAVFPSSTGGYRLVHRCDVHRRAN